MSDFSAFCDHLQVILNVFYLKLRRLMTRCLPLRPVDEWMCSFDRLLNEPRPGTTFTSNILYGLPWD